MFKSRYWREYPLLLQMLLLILMMFSLFSFSLAVSQLVIPEVMNVVLTDVAEMTERSPQKVINAALLFQLITVMFSFLIPAILFPYLTHPRPMEYLGLRKPRKNVHILLVLLIMMGATPVLLGIESLMRMIDLGAGLNQMQEENERMFRAFLTTMNSVPQFLLVFFILAILPAVSEELLFRGILMRSVHKRSKKTATAIAITSMIFAIVHYNPYGLFAIFLAAVLLGYIYYLTGSLWLSMLAHMFNNGLQIFIYYLAYDNPTLKDFVEGDNLPLYLPLGGAVLFAASMYMLWKQRTPLADNWSEDFTQAELIERAK